MDKVREQLIQEAMTKTKGYINDKLAKMREEMIESVNSVMRDIFSN